MPVPTPREHVLRRRVPVPLMVASAACLVVGAGLITWSPSGIPLVVGIALLVLGLVADTLALFRLLSDYQRITLDTTGMHVGAPRPADIGWDEVTAIRATGRILHIELRDQTAMVVDGEVYHRGFDDFSAELVTWLDQTQQRR